MVPIYKKEEEKSAVLAAVQRMQAELVEAGIRVKVDDRDNLTPGFKYNDWELRGVPLRMEIGPRDVANNVVMLARRDIPGRDGKQSVNQEGIAQVVGALLKTIQADMLAKATKFRDDHTFAASNYDEFKEMVQKGFVRAWWAGSNADEKQVQQETKATHRCYPLDQPGGEGICFYTGKRATRQAIFARAY